MNQPISETRTRNPHLAVTSPLQSGLLSALAVLFGSGVVALAAQVTVPFMPVPVTLQTLAVMLVGAALGGRLGFAALVAYLVEGAMGLPVFAPGGAPGLMRLVGPTAGYLWFFPVLAAAAGYGYRYLMRKGHRLSLVGAWMFVVLAAAASLNLLIGTAWLSHGIGFDPAWAIGFAPFIVIELCKAGLAAAILVVPGYFKKWHRGA
ncbi:MAG: biotin transporter BioY [Candidatus Symbiobacter sp.]|nr:biotin transporter BioY [Candidatus Symbiobacter sp.]